MATLKKANLSRRFEDALRGSGWQVLGASGQTKHPAEYLAVRDDRSIKIRVMIWNVTHGGASRSAGEYRIQITGLDKIQVEAHTKNLLLGWYDAGEVFGAWDIRQHLGSVSSSPSMQISKSALVQAAKTGFAPYVNQKGETAIAIRPDFMGSYIDFMTDLHDSGTLPAEASVLAAISENPTGVSDASISTAIGEKRKYAVVATKRALRALDFSKRVLGAYGHRCAMCGIQLQLLDAAHILPAAHEDSNDETCNGVALCSLHHRAYDRGLIYFDKSFKTFVNDAAIESLKGSGQTGGIGGFRKNLSKILKLPTKAKDRPAEKFIEKANALRGVS